MQKTKWILKCVLAGVFFLLVMGTVTLVLWNWLVPSLFNGPSLNLWEALGLLLLAKVLFGWHGRGWGKGPHWKSHWQHKLASMTPEERERFKARMREKWCTPGHGPTVPADEKNPKN